MTYQDRERKIKAPPLKGRQQVNFRQLLDQAYEDEDLDEEDEFDESDEDTVVAGQTGDAEIS